jgi:hypothetical protein
MIYARSKHCFYPKAKLRFPGTHQLNPCANFHPFCGIYIIVRRVTQACAIKPEQKFLFDPHCYDMYFQVPDHLAKFG